MDFFPLKRKHAKKKLKYFPSQEPNTHKHAQVKLIREISSESQEGDIQ